MDIPTLQDLIYYRFYKEWNEKIEKKDEIGAIKTLNNCTAALEATFDDKQKELFRQYKWAVDSANEYKNFVINENVMYVAIKIGMQLRQAFEPE